MLSLRTDVARDRKAAVDHKKLDKLMTFKEASDELGLPAYKFARAAKRGLIPTYSIFNSRKYVKLRDIIEIIESSRTPTFDR